MTKSNDAQRLARDEFRQISRHFGEEWNNMSETWRWRACSVALARVVLVQLQDPGLDWFKDFTRELHRLATGGAE